MLITVEMQFEMKRTLNVIPYRVIVLTQSEQWLGQLDSECRTNLRILLTEETLTLLFTDAVTDKCAFGSDYRILVVTLFLRWKRLFSCTHTTPTKCGEKCE